MEIKRKRNINCKILSGMGPRVRILAQVTIYRRLRIGRNVRSGVSLYTGIGDTDEGV